MGIRSLFRKLFLKNKKIKAKKARAKWYDSDAVKAARIDAGFRKIYAFIARGMKLNPAPKRRARHPKKSKRLGNRWFFRCGDAGYSRSTGKPMPYVRQADRISRY